MKQYKVKLTNGFEKWISEKMIDEYKELGFIDKILEEREL